MKQILNDLKLSLHKAFCILLFTFTVANLHAQVPVHQEPHHHLVFENKNIRILNVLIRPADSTQYHIHHTASLFINFTNTITASQLQGKEISKGKSVAGTIYFENLAAPNIRIHRVLNADIDTFHVIDLELLYSDTGFTHRPMNSPDLKIAVDTPWVRAYRLTLQKGKEFVLSNPGLSFTLIAFDGCTIQASQRERPQHQILKPGSFFDIKKGRSFSLKNIGDNTAEFVLIELPV